MELIETHLDDIIKIGSRDYLTNDFVGVLTWWDVGIIQVDDKANTGNESYYTEDSTEKYCELITYVLQHVAGASEFKTMGINYRGSEEAMSYPQFVTVGDKTFG